MDFIRILFRSCGVPWGPCVGFHAALPRGPPSCEYENLRRNHVCRHEANCFFFGNPHRKTVLFFGIDPGREDFRCSTRPGPALMRRKLFCPEIIFLPPRGNLFLFWEPTSQICSFFWDFLLRVGTQAIESVVRGRFRVCCLAPPIQISKKNEIGDCRIQSNPIRTDTEPIRGRYGPDTETYRPDTGPIRTVYGRLPTP